MEKYLYYQDQYLWEFKADIVKVVEKEGEYHLVLNQTAFYPEGGGQPADRGFIQELPVKDVYKLEERVYHILSELPSRQKDLNCRIDWVRRFDHMQQHLGQHILSAVFYDQYKAGTIGFHLGSDRVTIDLDRPLKPAEIIKAENRANEIVFANHGVEFFYVEHAQLKRLAPRKMPEITGPIRIVQISEIDTIPCSGTHPSRTGEVGLIKVISWSKYKQGLRVEFLCGKRVLDDFRGKNNCLNSLSALLSVEVSEVAGEVQKVIERNKSLAQQIKFCNGQLLTLQAEDLLNKPYSRHNGIKVIKKILTGQDYQQLRLLTLKLTANPGVVTLLGVLDDATARFIISRSSELTSLKMNEIAQELLPVIAGRGGGTQQLAQGGGPGVEQLGKLIELAYQRVLAILLSI